MKKNSTLRIIASLLTVTLLLPLALASCSGGESGIGRDDILASVSGKETTVTVGIESAGTSGDAPETTPPEDRDTRISFVACGDNIIHESIYLDAMTRATTAASTGAYSGKYYFDEMYDGIKELIQSADIAYVNQEGPIAGDDLGVSAYPNFNAPEEVGDTLIRLGFDIVNLANNHMLDMDNSRRTGYKNTLEYWKTKSVMTIGGYENSADYDTIRVYEKDGIRIAMLSYTYGTNGMSLSAASPDMVVPIIDDATITRHIAAAKEQADLVFVSMHWGSDNGGTSFNNTPNSEQNRLAKLITDCGADVIIGMHPHVIQPIEWLEREDGGKTLVIYSLGNLISTMLHSYNALGGIVSFDIVKDENGRITIEDPIMHPVMCHYTADPAVLDSMSLPTRTGIELYLLENYTEELAKKNGTQLYGAFTLDTLWNYVTSTVEPEFLESDE